MKKSLIILMALVVVMCGFAFAIHSDASAAISSEPQAGALVFTNVSQVQGTGLVLVSLGAVHGTDAIGYATTEPSTSTFGAVHFKDYATTKEGLGTVFTVTTGDTIISPSSTFLIGAAAETLGHSSAFQIDSAQTSAGQNILYVEYTEPSTMMIGATADGSTFDTTYVETASPPITIAMAETPGEHRTSVTSYAAVFLIDYTYVAYTKSFPAIGPC